MIACRWELYMAFTAVVICGDPKCSVIISEVHSDTPEKAETSEFVELRFNCGADIQQSLTNYKLLIIKALSGKGKATVETYVSFRSQDSSRFTRQPQPADFYFLLSDPDLKKDGQPVQPHISLSDRSRVYSRRLSSPTFRGIKGFFVPNANKYPHAVLLLQITDGATSLKFHNLCQKFSQGRPYVPLDNELMAILKRPGVVSDMVVYCRRSPFTSCDIFQTLCSTFSADRDYCLRDWDVTGQLDKSLSYCGEDIIEPLSPHLFKSGVITPGLPNDCSGTQFMLTSVLPQAAAAAQRLPRSSDITREEADVCRTSDMMVSVSSTAGIHEAVPPYVDDGYSGGVPLGWPLRPATPVDVAYNLTSARGNNSMEQLQKISRGMAGGTLKRPGKPLSIILPDYDVPTDSVIKAEPTLESVSPYLDAYDTQPDTLFPWHNKQLRAFGNRKQSNLSEKTHYRKTLRPPNGIITRLKGQERDITGTLQEFRIGIPKRKRKQKRLRTYSISV